MKLRSRAGVHSAEMVGGLLILVPIVLYGIDYTSMFYGGQMNSSCCSAACRSAAQGPPSGYGTATNTPKNRAMATLSRMVSPAAVVRVKKTVRVQEVVNPPVPQAPYGGPFQGAVTVKTRCDVFPPFLLPFVPHQVTLYTQQTYPWTYSMAANYTAATGGGSGGGGGTIPSGGGGGKGGGGPVGDLGQKINDSDP